MLPLKVASWGWEPSTSEGGICKVRLVFNWLLPQNRTLGDDEIAVFTWVLTYICLADLGLASDYPAQTIISHRADQIIPRNGMRRDEQGFMKEQYLNKQEMVKDQNSLLKQLYNPETETLPNMAMLILPHLNSVTWVKPSSSRESYW